MSMKKKGFVASLLFFMATSLFADYNGVIYIPTSVKYDVERGLETDLKYVHTLTKYVSYWNKSSLQKLCERSQRVQEDVNNSVDEIAEKFLEESHSFRHTGKIEIHKNIIALKTVIKDGLAKIDETCASQDRVKKDDAKKLLDHSKVMNKFYIARNKLATSISNYGKVIRAVDETDTSKFVVKYKGNKGFWGKYEGCEVSLNVENNKLVATYTDMETTKTHTRDFDSISQDKEIIKSFEFNDKITTNRVCDINGTTSANLNFKDGSLVEFELKQTSFKRSSPGFGIIIQCLNEEDADTVSKSFNCYDLKRM